MANLHLVTGYAGQAHVAASDQGSFVEALIRGGEFVMEAGANFAASVVTNNLIRVNDGELLMQGRHVKLAPGSYVDLAVENGAQGYLRNDLIVVRYTRNAENGIEECSLVVLKGTQAESNPSDPEYTTGSLNADGALQHDFPLYRVPLSGLNVGELEALFKPQKSLFASIDGMYSPDNKPKPEDIGAAPLVHSSRHSPDGEDPITPAQIGAAPASHGSHIPAAEAADNAKFLRNDNTWQKVTPANIGAATPADVETKAPKNHAEANTTYGVGDNTKFGHVKLSDSTNSTSDASGGVAATPAAVKAAYDLANGKAPAYTYGTEDLEAGVTALETGKLHFVYE